MKWLEGRRQLGKKKNKGENAQDVKPNQYAQMEGGSEDGFAAGLASFVGDADEVDFNEESEETKKIKVLI